VRRSFLTFAPCLTVPHSRIPPPLLWHVSSQRSDSGLNSSIVLGVARRRRLSGGGNASPWIRECTPRRTLWGNVAPVSRKKKPFLPPGQTPTSFSFLPAIPLNISLGTASSSDPPQLGFSQIPCRASAFLDLRGRARSACQLPIIRIVGETAPAVCRRSRAVCPAPRVLPAAAQGLSFGKEFGSR
jgi:hypothetical protein